MHWDSHYFRIDKPFLEAQGWQLENFTRVETFGDNQAKRDQRCAQDGVRESPPLFRCSITARRGGRSLSSSVGVWPLRIGNFKIV